MGVSVCLLGKGESLSLRHNDGNCHGSIPRAEFNYYCVQSTEYGYRGIYYDARAR